MSAQAPPPAAAAASAPSSSSSAARNRRKRKGKNASAAAAAVASPAGSSAVAAASTHSHSHSGGDAHSHAHPHAQHQHQHQQPQHGHSHDGMPCSGHGTPDSRPSSSAASGYMSSPFGDVDPHLAEADMQEAVHYCDVCWHYTNYATHSLQRIDRLATDFDVIPTSLQALVPSFPERMQRLRAAVVANNAFINEILAHRDAFWNTPETVNYRVVEHRVASTHPVDEERMGRVRSTIRQCVRDWSVEGRLERDACYGPILEELKRIYPTMESRRDVNVLIPGSGLGRLVWECASLGFDATGNEFSYFMLMCSFLVLNCCKSSNIFTIFPFIHEFKNVVSGEDTLRGVQIPDVDPTDIPEQGRLSMAAGDWMAIFSDLDTDYIHGMYKRKVQMLRKREEKEREERKKERLMKNKKKGATSPTAAAAATSSSSSAVAPTSPSSPHSSASSVASSATASSTTSGAAATSSSSPSTTSSSSPVIPDPIRGNSNASTWDVFASCYFVDCSTNILECIRTIAYVLRQGGHWINFGPLLYHFSEIPNECSVDLTYEELRNAIPYFGFELVKEKLGQPSLYASDPRSMLQTQYYCVSCTWKKVGEDRSMSLPLLSNKHQRVEEPKSVEWKSRSESQGEWNRLAVDAIDESSSEEEKQAAKEIETYLTLALGRQLGKAVFPSGGVAAVTSTSSAAAAASSAASSSTTASSSAASARTITVWSIPSTKLGEVLLFLTKLPSHGEKLNIGKIVVEGVEMLGVLGRRIRGDQSEEKNN